MSIDYQVLAQPKPEPRKRVKARVKRQQSQTIAAVRAMVFARDHDTCRVCGGPAWTMHELKFRSLGGKHSPENSIAVCGSGTTKCHGKLQRHRLLVIGTDANQRLTFVER